MVFRDPPGTDIGSARASCGFDISLNFPWSRSRPLALIISLHAGACDEHDHEREGTAGAEPANLVCHCACHAVTIAVDLTHSIAML